MITLDEMISQAQRHVDQGRLIVANQRGIAARLGTQFSAELLNNFERTQILFESDLADLLSRK
jgi:hypothetical protein